MVSRAAFQAADLGSIPGRGIDFCALPFLLSCSLNGQKVELKREKVAALCILRFSELKTCGPCLIFVRSIQFNSILLFTLYKILTLYIVR